MARPVLVELTKWLAANGGPDYIFDAIEAGVPVGKIASSITLPKHGEISRGLLYSWRNAGGAERKKRWKQAMAVAAHALVEDTQEALEALHERARQGLAHSEEVQATRMLAENNRWLAGVKNKEEYGKDDSAQVNVNLDIGQLHLDSLRRMGHATRHAEVEAEDADYELLEG